MRGRVVVVTGASSGLGRALAVELAGRGCALVLAARRADELELTAERCRALGADALVVPTDVSHEHEVVHLAAAALERWGRIDVWVNNAGVTYYQLLEEGPFEPHRQVLETNLFGAIYGARAVLPVFRRQRRGVLINVGSLLSEVGQAFVPSYVISKFAVRGLSEALRVEVADQPEIHVCTVLPYAIDTPHFDVAANQLGRLPVPLPPLQPPERVARAIADVAERPRRTRHVPRIAAVGVAVHALLPRTVERLLLASLRAWHFAERIPLQAGNLVHPTSQPAATHGSHRPRVTTAGLFAWQAKVLARFALAAVLGLTVRALDRIPRRAPASSRLSS